MCGICGVVNHSDHLIDKSFIAEKMNQTLQHRGPDDAGYYADDHAILAMRRLSIIDLTTGHQPLSNEDGSLWLVFNGEIYNYLELRADLQQKGHRFTTHSDSEVIIHAYEEYGDNCVQLMNGMFAFAIWHVHQQKLFIARDRLGIKPLYYWTQGQQFVFGSELKAVIAYPDVPCTINPLALDRFLTLEYIPAPLTIFDNIFKLPAGHYLNFQAGHCELRQYWNVPTQSSPPHSEQEYVEQLSSLIRDAVKLRLMSDVPIGAFLSGGIDSSTVVSFMSEESCSQVQTFSIGFEDQSYNELPYARLVASHFQTHHKEEILYPNILTLVEKLVAHLDEPLADFSIIPTYLVSEVAGREVKVILSGDGGDELFGGYDTYLAQRASTYYQYLPTTVTHTLLPTLFNKLPPQPAKKGIINKAKRFVEGGTLPAELQHTRWMMFMQAADKAQLYHPDLRRAVNGDGVANFFGTYFRQSADLDPLGQQQYVDIKTYLADNILTKVDRMSMAASIEVRVPLLDYRIVEFAMNVPQKLKINGRETKYLLRRVAEQRLPGAILSKPKQGFSIPIKHWLCNTLRPLMLELLSEESVRRRGYFHYQPINHWVSEHLAGRANHSHRLWALLVLELWQRHVLEEAGT